MTTQLPKATSSRRLSSPASVAGVLIGTYCAVVTLLLASYYALNYGLLSESSSRYRADSAFTISVITAVSIAFASISPDFKRPVVFVWCFLVVMLISCVSVPLHLAVPDFIQWYTGPLWTGLLGGLVLLVIFVRKWRK